MPHYDPNFSFAQNQDLATGARKHSSKRTESIWAALDYPRVMQESERPRFGKHLSLQYRVSHAAPVPKYSLLQTMPAASVGHVTD